MNGMGVYDDKVIPGLRRLTDSVHAVGGKIALEIAHGGRECSSEVRTPASRSFNLVSRYRGITKKTEMPHGMTLEEIGLMTTQFGHAGRRAKEAGFDAVEIHAAHGYLISEFLSPYSNKRTDRYSGDVRGRSKFLIEIVEDIKRRTGLGFPVIVKFNISDYVEDGTTAEEATMTAKMVVEAGADAIVASVGFHELRPYMMIPTMLIPALLTLNMLPWLRIR